MELIILAVFVIGVGVLIWKKSTAKRKDRPQREGEPGFRPDPNDR